MSLERIVRTVVGRMSLREPQTTSLERLHNALESVPSPDFHEGVLIKWLSTIKQAGELSITVEKWPWMTPKCELASFDPCRHIVLGRQPQIIRLYFLSLE